MSDAGRERGVEVPNETVINWQAPPLKFGLGQPELERIIRASISY
jgi:hypothetical protein